jgi:glycogen debranching enzyme
LFSGIAAPERAARVADTLLMPEMASGWGIRTLASDAARFNPMSYHNGSIWPHDNALIALGLGHYGLKRGTHAIFDGLFAALLHMDMMRLPELFCGFPRRRGAAPTLYPVACSPQAWASVAPFALLQACLGLRCDFASRELRFHNPELPAFLGEVRIADLRLGEASVDLRIKRQKNGTEVAVLSRRGDIAIKITQ